MKNCLNCNIEFTSKDKRQKFCGRSCSSTFTNARRPGPTEEHKKKVSESLKKFYETNESKSKGWEHAQKVGNAIRGRHKSGHIKTIYEVSSRTKSKIISRLNLSCCICGWKEDKIDIHHIIPRKNGGSDELTNLTPLCPNHHRLADRKKIDSVKFIPLSIILPRDWADKVYFG